ncbi:hypothetical protein MKX01_017161 [Papaver californicum]|nr:hypothetical protein MKX01_017161 [Papaver californicum]
MFVIKVALIFFFFLFILPSLVFSFTGLEMGKQQEEEEIGKELFPDSLRVEAVSRLNELGEVSDAEGHLERTFMSPASKKAINLVQSWMEDAGLRTWVDQMGNVHGRAEGMKTHAEVIAFSDEEGVRFQSTFLGSAAIAGTRPASALQISDKSGVTVQDVLKENSFDATEESYLQLKYDPQSVWGYIEVHIEQGPVLESVGLPLGVVTVRGSQGHAGTVPMTMRQDPMTAAAELIVLLETMCKNPADFVSYDRHCNGFAAESLAGSLVCTVGEISSWPGASNVIPGQVTFTVDLRTMDDMAREAIIFEISNKMYQNCERRSVSCIIERKHDAEAVMCDAGLSSELKSAANSALKRVAGEIQHKVPVLMSGAGHDAMAMSHLTKVGMLFVRCRGGISHSPAEHVLDDDVWIAGLAILAFLETNL